MHCKGIQFSELNTFKSVKATISSTFLNRLRIQGFPLLIGLYHLCSLNYTYSSFYRDSFPLPSLSIEQINSLKSISFGKDEKGNCENCENAFTKHAAQLMKTYLLFEIWFTSSIHFRFRLLIERSCILTKYDLVNFT